MAERQIVVDRTTPFEYRKKNDEWYIKFLMKLQPQYYSRNVRFPASIKNV